MKIEFGCGETPTKKDFKTCDIRNLPDVDFVCPAWEIDNFVAADSVDEIFSRHFFEHLTFFQGKVVMSKWYNILKPQGVCEVIVPNLIYHINQFVNKRNSLEDFEHALAGLWGWQRGEFSDYWDVHKSGYDKDSLIKLMREVGFKNLESLESNTSKHLRIKGTK